MPLLSDLARARKLAWFFAGVPLEARILEIGCGDCWSRDRARAAGYRHYAGLDLRPPADFVGDIRDWRALGLAGNAYDVIVAFEVVEHVPCFAECHALLRPGGLLFITTPVPRMDSLLAVLESLHLTQRRTSAHAHLIDLRDLPLFERVALRRIAGLVQWGKFRKPAA
ncbi:MAG: class I SAM-dependent methyltransferase [Candidatus Hydrogenedentes bacterium]|nr:class I SAM-dependent methyltransferase [Candidatus Hydrogenedentota bacterium]